MKQRPNLKTAMWLFWPVLILVGLGFFRLTTNEKYGAGKILYQRHCASCHMEDGTGLRAFIPPLAGADYVQNGGAEMACLIRYGIAGEMLVNGVVFNQPMYGHVDMKDIEIRNIINYIKNAWGNEGEEISFAEIKAALTTCEGQKPIPTP